MMRPDVPIGAVEAEAYTVPTDAPNGDGTLTWDSTTIVVVRARAGGRTGLGWTYAPAAAVPLVQGILAETVLGRDALTPVDSHDAMARAVRNAGRPGLVGMGLSAVDIALWDLCGRIHDRSLPHLWGSSAAPVPVYGSGGFTTYTDEQLTSQIGSWLDLGLSHIKIKIGESWGSHPERDLQRTERTVDLIGDNAGLFVDANGGYSTAQAIRIGHRLDDLGVTWFEEPVSSDDLPGLEAVRTAVCADVTAGEYGYNLTYFEQMTRTPAVDCLQVDVTRCGGYTEWFRIIAVAQSRNLDISGHCAPYLTVPVAAATPRLRHLEWFHDHVRIEQSLFDGCPDPTDAHLTVNDLPGHGIAFRTRAADPFRVQ